MRSKQRALSGVQTTMIQGVTSSDLYLLTRFNDKQIGIPLYTFSYSVPNIDLISIAPDTNFVVDKTTFASTVTAYGAGITIFVNGTACALPIFKTVQDPNIVPEMRFQDATIVSNLTSTGQFFAVKVGDTVYGAPMYNYSSVYPFTSSVAQSSINITTKMVFQPSYDITMENGGSTNLNSKIQTYSQLIARIKYQIGYPFVNVELCDDTQIVDFIDQSLEWYTKYAGYTEEFLVFSSTMYEEPGLKIDTLFTITPNMRTAYANGLSGSFDYDLQDYRKVIGVFSFDPGESTGINTLFTLEQAMAQQTYFSYMLGNAGFDLVTWEVLKEWLDLREKVLAQKHFVDFDQYNQTLRLIPAPNQNSAYYGCVGAWVEKPVVQLLSEQWVQKYALALAKISVGNVRGKYQGMQMFGGGTINYNDLLSQGLKEKDALEAGLQEGSWYDTAPPRFFIGIFLASLIPVVSYITNMLGCFVG